MRLRWPNKPKFKQRYLGTAIRHRSLSGQEATLAQVASRPSGCRLRSVTGRRHGIDANLIVGQPDQPPLFAVTPRSILSSPKRSKPRFNLRL